MSLEDDPFGTEALVSRGHRHGDGETIAARPSSRELRPPRSHPWPSGRLPVAALATSSPPKRSSDMGRLENEGDRAWSGEIGHVPAWGRSEVLSGGRNGEISGVSVFCRDYIRDVMSRPAPAKRQ